METNHTPGPWEIREQPVKKNGFYIQTKNYTRRDSFIGEVGGGLQDLKTVKANAELIASAPDLQAQNAAQKEELDRIRKDCDWLIRRNNELHQTEKEQKELIREQKGMIKELSEWIEESASRGFIKNYPAGIDLIEKAKPFI